ncbi:MAG TPA: hypothetical protein ENK15_06285 [Thermopetrobacter sp.]|nr:hypothetical protein [Thermopetrobacter sp.]
MPAALSQNSAETFFRRQYLVVLARKKGRRYAAKTPPEGAGAKTAESTKALRFHIVFAPDWRRVIYGA